MGKGSINKDNEEVSLFRVMSEAEYNAIIANGNRFPYYQFAMYTKWFAVNLEDLDRWAA